MNQIKSIHKEAESGSIRYWVETRDGDQYQVVHLIREQKVLERIYYLRPESLPPCISRREYPLNHMPVPSFKDIIEGRGRSS